METASGRRFQAINYGMALIMAASAALQWNDPDPWYWVSFYLAGAGACLQSGRWAMDWMPPLLVGLVGLFWALRLVPDASLLGPMELIQSMDSRGGAVEIAREFGGLCICTAWMAMLAAHRWQARRKQGPDRP